MSRRPDLGRGARLTGAVVCAAAGLAIAGAQAFAAVSEPAATQETSNVVTLSDDDSAKAMFDAEALPPGEPVARCLEVSYEGEGPATLRLYGTATGTGLAPHLSLLIEQGRGGGFASCAGFTGRPVYTGTLADFTARHADFASGLPLSTVPGSAPVTYRFTAVVADVREAQGRKAAADIWWEARSSGPDDTPPPTQEPSPAPTTDEPVPPTAEPTRSPEATRTPSTTRTPAAPPAPTAKPSATSSPTPVATPPTTAVPEFSPPAHVGLVPAKKKGDDQGALASAGQRLRRLFDWTASFAAEGTKQAAFPGLLILLAFLFLLVQDRIDRRDPKLALAPVHADPDLTFRRLEDRP